LPGKLLRLPASSYLITTPKAVTRQSKSGFGVGRSSGTSC